MPFSADNENRNRNYVIAVLAGVAVFAIIMGGYVTLALADRDTDSYIRFLTLLVVTLIPSSLGAWNAYKAQKHASNADETAKQVAETTQVVADKLNGELDARIKNASVEAIKEVNDGRPSV